jgi:hypothetical protein
LAAALLAADTISPAFVQSFMITQQSEFFVHLIGPAVSFVHVVWSPVHPDPLLVPEPWLPSCFAVTS